MSGIILLLAFAIIVVVLIAIFGSDPYTAPEIREHRLVTPKMTLFDYDWGLVFWAFFCILLALGLFTLLLKWLGQFLPEGM